MRINVLWDLYCPISTHPIFFVAGSRFQSSFTMEQLRMSIVYLSIVLAVFTLLIFILLGILLYRKCCRYSNAYRSQRIQSAPWHLSWKDITLFEDGDRTQTNVSKLADTLSLCSQVSYVIKVHIITCQYFLHQPPK